MQRIFLAVAALTSAVLLHPGSAQAQNYPWCAQYNSGFGGQNCGFSTLQQCRASVSGVGGFCVPNPMVQAQVNQSRRRYRQRLW